MRLPRSTEEGIKNPDVTEQNPAIQEFELANVLGDSLQINKRRKETEPNGSAETGKTAGG